MLITAEMLFLAFIATSIQIVGSSLLGFIKTVEDLYFQLLVAVFSQATYWTIIKPMLNQ